MKTDRNRNVQLVLHLLCLLLFANPNIQAQETYRPIGWPSNGAESLRLGRVDTTDVVKIRQIADSCGHHLNPYACLFLAQHGERGIIPKIIDCYYQSYQRLWLRNTYKLTVALATLDTELAHPFVLALFDSMIVHNNELKGKYTSYDFVKVIELLLDLKDYSKYGSSQ